MINGDHNDPFAVLGPHSDPDGDGLQVRVLLPGATAVDLLHSETSDCLLSLQPVHPAGLFEGYLEGRQQPFAYRLRASWGPAQAVLHDPYRFPACLAPEQLYYLAEGTEEFAWRLLGANTRVVDGVAGVLFAVWAPNARRVSVVGDFNDWNGCRHPMRLHPSSGVWELFIPELPDGTLYKYEILGPRGVLLPLKADPYARGMQHPPQTASRVVAEGAFQWGDGAWLERRAANHAVAQPISIYEVHAGSWRRREAEGNRYLSYLEMAEELLPYVREQGFTHIQLMPVSEYPFDGSWGYQPLGLYAPSIRFGTPDEFRRFVDTCHAEGIGVLLDWVPGHFPTDPHGLGRFDGTALYEHADRRQGFHPDWNTLIYNYGRGEVVSYLISNANYWLEEFHLDGLRVDAVASMLYLDYSRREGEWIANLHGGRENLEAITLLKEVNRRIYARHPGVLMVAEESTAWPGVSQPVDSGGLGFGFKWNMGWMNDSLRYMERDPVHRRFHHDEMTFGIVYAWDENFVLPLSHDEVVHGKRSLLFKMPGDDWQQFANLRAFLAFMWGYPGKKLLFMGGEFAQRREWNHDRGLDWHLLEEPAHRGVQQLVRDLNAVYRSLAALHRHDCEDGGFNWLQANQRDLSVFAWLRWGGEGQPPVLVIANFTPRVHHGYCVGAPLSGWYEECINSDASAYGGSGQGNLGGAQTLPQPADGQPCSLQLTVPPLATLILVHRPDR
nr:1,4-alpha-glucan branching protein GlgB [Parahaliea maris]